MSNFPATLLTATVTVLAILFYFYASVRTGRLRAQLGIQAPATIGHPTFERAFRVQLNTLEQMGLFLPLLWLTAFYPISLAWLAPLIGCIWVLGRVIYLRAYMANPQSRLPGAAISLVTNLALLIIAVIGLIRAWTAA